MAITCALAAPVPAGVTINPTTCQVTIDSTGYLPGTYTFTVIKTDDSTQPATVEECPEQFVVVAAEIPKCVGCVQQPQFVDCNGELIEVTTDSLGNPVMVLCSGATAAADPCVVDWNSATSQTGLPPLDPEGITLENLCEAFDVINQCFTHKWYQGTWIDKCCGCTTTPVDPETAEICYDLNNIPGNQYCFGEGTTGWYVSNVNQHAIECADSGGDTAQTAYPQTVLASTDYFEYAGVPPAYADINALFAGAFDTGQASGQSTVIAVSGDSGTQPYLGSDRPLVFVDFGLDDQCHGPFTIGFSNPDPGQAIGFALWDSNANEYLANTQAIATGGTVISYQNINGPGINGSGDYIVIDTAAQNVATVPFYELTYGNSGTVLGSGIYPVFVSLGNQANAVNGPVEQITDIYVDYVRSAVETGSCCECHTSGSVSATLNQVDPNGYQWVIINDRICATVSLTHVDLYGNLVFCEGTAAPVITSADPPEFTTAPPSIVCVDDLTTVCADCVGGTVTAQELVNGAWTNV